MYTRHFPRKIREVADDKRGHQRAQHREHDNRQNIVEKILPDSSEIKNKKNGAATVWIYTGAKGTKEGSNKSAKLDKKNP